MPNFLSIALDDLIAYQSMRDMFGQTLVTPNIDRLADMGVNFENAFSQIALCNPSRASILSGLRPDATGVHDNNDGWYNSVSPAETMPALLAEQGFRTSVIGKVFHQPASSLNFIPETREALADVELVSDQTDWNGTSLPFRAGVLDSNGTTHGDYVNTTTAIERIEAWGSENEAVFLGIYRPHSDWTAPQQYFDLYNPEDIARPLHPYDDIDDLPDYVRGILNDWYHEDIVEADAWTEVLHAYFASVSFADAQVGRVLDALEATGQIDNTVVALWSDHGYHLGDKENWHKFTLWDEAGRAPLILAGPDAPEGETVTEVVELLDIFPTVFDMLGLPVPEAAEGRSLVPHWESPEAVEDGFAITTMYGSISMRTDFIRYSLYEDGSEEFYDIVADPNQVTNLIGNPAYAALIDTARAELQAFAEAHDWNFVSGTVDLSAESDPQVFVVNAGDDTVFGGSGDDTYFLHSPETEIVEAEDGGTDRVYVSFDYTLPENVEIAYARHHFGGNQRELIGNDSDNRLSGASDLEGRGGDDVLRLWLSGTADGGPGDDDIVGSAQDDTLIGGDGRDELRGREGDDILRPGAGSYFVNGSSGSDWLDFSDMTTGVTASLAAPFVREVENLAGSPFDDFLTGDGEDNLMRGGTGADVIDGAGGFDTLMLPVTVDNVTSAQTQSDGSVLITLADGTEIVARGVERIEDSEGAVLTPDGPETEGGDTGDGDTGGGDTETGDTGGGATGVLSSDLLVREASGDTRLVEAATGAVRGELGTTAPGAVLGVADTDGDGDDEILVRQADGRVAATDEDGARAGFAAPGELRGIADLDGDGRDDLIFEDAAGGVVTRDGTGARLEAFSAGDSSVEAVGDLDGDGGADLLLRGADGTLSMAGPGGTGYGSLLGHEVVDLADFNGDGADDLLMWRESDGATYTLDGTDGSWIGGFSPRPREEILGTGDFDGDGRDDLLLRQGEAGMRTQSIGWEMGAFMPQRAGAEVAGIADLDGDGGDDILLREDGGRLIGLDGSTGTQIGDFGVVAPDAVLGLRDVNGDGAADLLLRAADGGIEARSGTGEALGRVAPTDATLPLEAASRAPGAADRAATWIDEEPSDGPETEGGDTGDGDTETGDTGGSAAGVLSSDLLVREASGDTRLVDAASGAVRGDLGTTAPGAVLGVADTDGDGDDEILVRQSDGRIAATDEDGARAGFAAPGALRGIADLDGDGRDDLIFEDGASGVVTRDGTGARLEAFSAADSSVEAVGDLDGDGGADLLLRGADGTLSMAGPGGTGYGSLLGHEVVDLADFNGDGADDLLMWRESDGATYTLDGTDGSWIGGFSPRPREEILGTGDFDGDGRDDLLLRQGEAGMRTQSIGWEMGAFMPQRAGAEVAGIADLDGDGGDDILLREDDGRLIGLDGSTGTPIRDFGVVAPDAVLGLRDVNGDGAADLLLRAADGGIEARSGTGEALGRVAPADATLPLESATRAPGAADRAATWIDEEPSDGPGTGVGDTGGDTGTVEEDGQVPSPVKLTAPDGAAFDYFGHSAAVSADGQTIVIGALYDDDRGGDSGSAYVFDQDGTLIAKLTALDGAGGDHFGTSVAMSDDGQTIVVGAWLDDENGTNSGAAYVFDRDGTQIAKLADPDGTAGDEFGYSAAVSADGRIIVVGAPFDDVAENAFGSAHIFNRDGSQIVRLTAADEAGNDFFGASTAVSADGQTIVVGAFDGTGSGSAHVFGRDGSLIARLTASDGAASDAFGASTTVSADGQTIVVGAQNDSGSGAAYVFDRDGTQIARLTAADGAAGDSFGASTAVSADGQTIVLGAQFDDDDGSQSGSAYVFDRDGTQLAKLTAPDGAAFDRFGWSVAISADGQTIVTGAYGDDDNGGASGSAYTFLRNDNGDFVDLEGNIYGPEGITGTQDIGSALLATTGQLGDTDAGLGDPAFEEIAAGTAGSEGYGTFELTAEGAWTYTLDNASPRVQGLSEGEEVFDRITASPLDGSGSQVIEVTIAGTNDAPVVAPLALAPVSEDAGPITIDLLDRQEDPDVNDTLSVQNIVVTDESGTAVVFTDNGDGSLSIEPGQFTALASGESRDLTVDYEVTDGFVSIPTTASVTIEGADDAPALLSTSVTAPTDEDLLRSLLSLDPDDPAFQPGTDPEEDIFDDVA